jgi:hypothetical protein
MLILGAGTATSYTFTGVTTLVGNTAQGELPDRPVTTTFQYDPFGRKVRKIVTDGVHPSQTTRYAYSGGRVLEEQDNTGTPKASYVYGRYFDEPIQMKRDGGTALRMRRMAPAKASSLPPHQGGAPNSGVTSPNQHGTTLRSARNADHCLGAAGGSAGLFGAGLCGAGGGGTGLCGPVGGGAVGRSFTPVAGRGSSVFGASRGPALAAGRSPEEKLSSA